MKIKATLIAAATLAVGVISSQAQVYSQNIVGYVNIQLTNGFNAFANQLDFDGTGTNNTVYSVIGTNLPPSTKIYTYDPVLGGYRNISLSGSGVWSSGVAGPYVAKSLQPGGGVFVFIPGSGVSTNFTIVGTVLQKTNITTYPSQYQFVGNPFPIAGYVTTNLNYTPNQPVSGLKDKVLTWNVGSQSFTTHQYGGSSWTAGTPNLSVGQAFFLVPNQSTAWTNSFIAQ